MFLTTKGRYAIMAMVDMSMQNGLVPIRLGEIADRQQIALAYLEQIFAKLRKNQLVAAVRGPGGGYKLSKPSTDICIEEIMLAVGEKIKMTKCSAGNWCTQSGKKCPTHDLWAALQAEISMYLRSLSLADARQISLRSIYEGAPSAK